MSLRLDDGSQAWSQPEGIVLAVTATDSYNESIRSLTKALVAEAQGVFITANRPSHLLRQSLEADGIATDRLFFVDCVTSMTGVLAPREPHVTHIESPSMLEKISLRAEQALQRIEGPRFLILDSLSTLAIYNGAEAVTELAHSMITRLRLRRIAAALLLVTPPVDTHLRETMESLCDGVLTL